MLIKRNKCFLGKNIYVLCPFLKLVILLLSSTSSLYILDINTLLAIQFADILFYRLPSHIVFFAMQQCFSCI